MTQNQHVIVAGSGLAAAAAARALVAAGRPVTLIDEREPVATHSISEAEWYSAWWPGADESLTRFASLGIDRLEALHRESGEAFQLNRRGQLFVTSRPETVRSLEAAAGRHASHGGGPIREHAGAEWYLRSPVAGFRGVSDGLDLLSDGALHTVFPFLAPTARLGVHVRRAGWVDARRLRRWLLSVCRSDGGVVVPETITEIGHDGAVWSVQLGSGASLTAGTLLLAGSRARHLARRAGFQLPWLEATRLIAHLDGGSRILPGPAPVVVAVDVAGGPGALPAEVAPTPGTGSPSAFPTEQGALRIETIAVGSVRPDQLMAIGEATLRELSSVIPDLATRRGPPGVFSIAAAPLSLVGDGRPVIGQVDRRGGYLLAGLAGGVTVVLAAAELIASYVLGRPLPGCAPGFAPARLQRVAERAGLAEARS